MRSPHRPRPARAAATLSVAALVLAASSACAVTPGVDESARRRTAIARWDACIERELSALGEDGTDLARVGRRCEGHRRDVLDAFPVHLGARVERMMDARAARRLGNDLDGIGERAERLYEAVALPRD